MGTGSGEAALRLSRSVGPMGKVVAVDEKPEMLRIAGKEAARRGAGNVEFRETSTQSMDLPGGSFDSVVRNHSLCCNDYRVSLAECFRVLKPEGLLTYNHGGPVDPPAYQIMYCLSEGHKTKTPSESLKEMHARRRRRPRQSRSTGTRSSPCGR